MASRKLYLGVIGAIAVVGIAAAAAVAWRPEVPAITPPAPGSFGADVVKRGRALAALGNCNDCHMVRGGKAFAGGLPVPTPFGTIFSANISPDAETGIGAWSFDAFRRAMRSGVNRVGQHLYPTFPYDHFTHVSDDDDKALYAYLMTRPAVHARVPANNVAFPLDQRPLVAGWKLLFLKPDSYRPDPAHSDAWNRGAYLVEGLAHCGACHTPRNKLGAERVSARFDGGDVDDWQAYPLNDRSTSPVPWTADALFTYLRTGMHPDHGVARGPMAQVVSNLSSVPESDVRAIATYIADLNGGSTDLRDKPRPATEGDRVAAADAAHPAGAAIYRATCSGCHESSRALPYGGLDLGRSSSVHASDPRNLVNTILTGIRPVEGERSAIMPGFADSIDDQQMFELVTYLRARSGEQPAWDRLDAIVKQARASQLAYIRTTAGVENAPDDRAGKGKP